MKDRFKYRHRFSYADDQSMLKFLVSELKSHNFDAMNPFGDKIWHLAAKRKILSDGNHTVMSIRDHFRRQLWPYLDLQPISREDKEYLKTKLKKTRPKYEATSE